MRYQVSTQSGASLVTEFESIPKCRLGQNGKAAVWIENCGQRAVALGYSGTGPTIVDQAKARVSGQAMRTPNPKIEASQRERDRELRREVGDGWGKGRLVILLIHNNTRQRNGLVSPYKRSSYSSHQFQYFSVSFGNFSFISFSSNEDLPRSSARGLVRNGKLS